LMDYVQANRRRQPDRLVQASIGGTRLVGGAPDLPFPRQDYRSLSRFPWRGRVIEPTGRRV
ncbi:MAG TPA: hypothetical protein VGM32_09910, partial [Rhodopila sp.]